MSGVNFPSRRSVCGDGVALTILAVSLIAWFETDNFSGSSIVRHTIPETQVNPEANSVLQ